MTENTPTGDEREALANAFDDMHQVTEGGCDTRGDDVADMALRLGFRRSKVPEPSAEHPDHSKLGPSACPACDFDPMKPQGEPSDAQVGRAVVAYRDERNRHGHMNSDIHFRCMRAALRAAGTVR